jgi:hypothetical protein
LKAFGVLTRRDEPLSDVAATFVEHLKRSARGKSVRRGAPDAVGTIAA